MGVEYRKKIICLANSRKLSGRCVAGKEVDAPHRWVRPVGPTLTGELSPADISFKPERVLRPLDVISICMLQPKPHSYQSENYEIDQRYFWNFSRRADFSEIEPLVDPAKDILWHNDQRTFHGRHDRVHANIAADINESLKLVCIDDLVVRVLAEQEKYGNNALKIRGFFTWGGVEYALLITDPIYEDKFHDKGAGSYELGDAVLCLSLGEIHTDGYAYKLIAGVLLPS